MNLQDLYPNNDFTLLGLNNQYSTVGVAGFLINSPSIIANDHIVITGHSYLIVKANHEEIIVQPARLIDAYYDNLCINLLMEDIGTGMWFTIQQYLDSKNHHCPWVLIDLTFLKNVVEKQSIYAYCNSQ